LTFFGRIKDLGLSGMGIEILSPVSDVFPPGSEVEITFRLPSESSRLRIRGTVTWCGQGVLGIEIDTDARTLREAESMGACRSFVHQLHTQIMQLKWGG
jgi:hypothetical protein